mgnify:CR=1 FL=1
MSLKAKLQKRKCPSEQVTIAGEKFTVTGKSLNDVSAVMAKCRNAKGTLNGDKLDRELLSSCVADEDGTTDMTPDDWGGVPRQITGPLMKVILSLCGLDSEDIQRDPKDSDSTQS